MNMKLIVLATLAAHLGVALAGDYDDYVTLLGDNSGNKGESTFVTNIVRSNYGWSDGKDPHSGTKYYCGKQLCTPKVKSGAYKFAGDRLVMAAGFRVLADGQTLTIDDFVLENGGFIQTAGASYRATFCGNLTVRSNASSPAIFKCGQGEASYVIASAFKGASSAWCRAEMFSSYLPANRFVQLDDAALYEGTVEVCANVRLKLFSDLPGTIVATNGAAVEIGADKTVGSLVLDPGTTLDLSAGGTLALTSLVATNGVTLVAAPPTTAGAKALVTVPAGGGMLDAKAFTLSLTSDAMVRLWAEDKAGMQTLFLERLAFDTYDAETGFVTNVLSSTSSTRNLFVNPEAWSDGQAPHPDTNYYTTFGIWLSTNTVFNGRSLTAGGIIRFGDGTSLTVTDLRLQSCSSERYFTTAGGSTRTYLHGGMTVMSRASDEIQFAFLGSEKNGQTWVSDQTIRGDAESALVARGHGNSAPGAASNYVELLGDLSDFKGTLIVQHNETVRLGNVVFPGTVRLETACSHLATVADEATVAKVGTLDVRAATSVEVPNANELAVSSVLLDKALSKTGAGVFAVAAVDGDTPAVNVQEGRFKALSADAVQGATLTFSAGTGVAVDYEPSDAQLATSGVDLRETTVTITETISVLVQATERPEGTKAEFVPICTVTTAQADALEGKIASVRVAFDGKSRTGALVRRPAGEGVCVLGADVTARGFCLIFR